MADDKATAEALYCPECDYDLRGLDSGRCPECGAAFDLDELRRPQIPWSQRREIGRFRAYWRTVWMVMFRNARFCREMCRPVSWSDAQRFRWVTVLHVYVGLAILTVPIGRILSFEWFDDPDLDAWLGPVWPVVLGHVLFLLWLGAVTGVQSYWFHPRGMDNRRQSRATALSYCACAPLASMPITAALFGYGLVAHVDGAYWSFPGIPVTIRDLQNTPLPFVLGYALAAVQLVGWWFMQIQMARRTVRPSGLGLLAFAVATPVCWLLLAALIFVGIPVVVGYVILIATSLG